ncbi:efflux RND transporter periplasmic adaptor subunit [Uliginosibacterium sp. 31-12]|uniref:efflux RND transporter periplasmic adaptor subunit n=1 Tax=Uliginosibacterium sp. 31-12 TaxID=3062781 RepID=UPI0026E2B689|nr:efflux RND transporter periplasmic adaptor subunit [Uliginosibacterium sp. 31-12]MDO6386541.1 efflux RND transporter periplasmic adaptor subunit [Uliginosibacterium sp. 31-12]
MSFRLLACIALVHVVSAAAQPAGKPALTVSLVTPQAQEWSTQITANGSIAAWQEAIIGAEIGGLRLDEVAVNVGDHVKRGQVLARMQRDVVEAELAQSRASLAEAEAALFEAKTNADRARQIKDSGTFSAQQVDRYITSEATAQARVEVLKAKLRADQLRMDKTVVRAPDDGTISARSATLGAVLQAGQELFRLIRQDRLEWRAELPAADLAKVKPGMTAQVFPASGEPIAATVRALAPTVDPKTRNALVYADIKTRGEARPGMFARGEIRLGVQKVLTLPQGAVLLRDGFAYVFRLGTDSRVLQTKVTLGRRQGERVEVSAGLEAGSQVVVSGVGFLADGDLVRVAPAAAR